MTHSHHVAVLSYEYDFFTIAKLSVGLDDNTKTCMCWEAGITCNRSISVLLPYVLDVKP